MLGLGCTRGVVRRLQAASQWIEDAFTVDLSWPRASPRRSEERSRFSSSRGPVRRHSFADVGKRTRRDPERNWPAFMPATSGGQLCLSPFSWRPVPAQRVEAQSSHLWFFLARGIATRQKTKIRLHLYLRVDFDRLGGADPGAAHRKQVDRNHSRHSGKRLSLQFFSWALQQSKAGSGYISGKARFRSAAAYRSSRRRRRAIDVPGPAQGLSKTGRSSDSRSPRFRAGLTNPGDRRERRIRVAGGGSLVRQGR